MALTIGPSAAWRLVFAAKGQVTAPGASSTSGIHETGTALWTGNGGGLLPFYLDPADGATTELEGVLTTNDTALGTNLVIEMLAVGAASGATSAAVSIAAGTVQATVTFTTPAANAKLRQATTIPTPAAGFYFLRYTTGGSNAPANNGFVIRANVKQR